MPDAIGNLFKTQDRTDRKYGPAGQLLESRGPDGITRYEYDPEGNLARKLEPDGREWRFRWSLTGTLTEVVRPDGEIVAFTYDALGRRLSKTYRGKTTRWMWDGNVPLHEWVELTDEALARDGEPLANSFEREIAIAKRKALLSRRSSQGPPELIYPTAGDQDARLASPELDADDVPLLEGTADAPITWLFEPESFAPLGKIVGDERYSIVTDHLGTPIAMFDGHGEQAWTARLDSYGRLDHVSGGRRACPFRFPGQYEDVETGLYYNRFRYYDPDAGAYVSQDPLRLRAGLHPHAYVDDPLVWLDPLGLAPAAGCGQPRYTQQSRSHVYTHGHAANSPQIPNKSRFRPTEGGQKFSDEVVNHPAVVVTHQGNGRVKYEVADLGRTTGLNQAGNSVRGGTVIVEGQTPLSWSTYTPDEVVTQFPT